MARIGLVDRGAEDGATVEALHPFFPALGFPAGLRKRDAEQGFSGFRLVSARDVHGSCGGGAHEGRRLLHDGQDLGGDADDLFLLDELAQAAQDIAETLQQVIRRGMVFPQLSQHLAGAALGVDPLGRLLQSLLIAPQIGVPHLLQAVQGDIHHFVIEEFLSVVLRADAEVTLGNRQQVVVKENLVFAQGVNHRRVAALELCQQLRVLDLRKSPRNILPEKVDHARHLLQGDFCINPRRVLEVLPGSHDRPRYRAFPGDYGTQSHLRRSEVSLDDQVDAAGDSGSAEVGVLPPHPDRLELQQARLDGALD